MFGGRNDVNRKILVITFYAFFARIILHFKEFQQIVLKCIGPNVCDNIERKTVSNELIKPKLKRET